MNTYIRQLWLSVKIWLVAVAVNTILGTAYLSNFKLHEAADFMIVGACLGAFFSFPIMLIISLIINGCAAAGKTGRYILSLLFLSNVILAIIVFMVFFGKLELSTDMIILPSIGICSGIIAITIFYRSILKWGSDFNTNAQ